MYLFYRLHAKYNFIYNKKAMPLFLKQRHGFFRRRKKTYIPITIKNQRNNPSILPACPCRIQISIPYKVIYRNQTIVREKTCKRCTSCFYSNISLIVYCYNTDITL